MRFDITNLDLRILVRALIAYADPKGRGKEEYNFKKAHGFLVDSISEDKLESAIAGFEARPTGHYCMFDYFNGKPIKLDITKTEKGRLLAGASGYDTRNGKYKFLQVLLDIFSPDEIRIVQKSYGHMETFNFPKSDNTDENIKFFQTLVKSSVKNRDNYGIYWTITSNLYKSPMERFLQI